MFELLSFSKSSAQNFIYLFCLCFQLSLESQLPVNAPGFFKSFQGNPSLSVEGLLENLQLD